MNWKTPLVVAVALAAGIGLGQLGMRQLIPERTRVVEADFTRLGVHGTVLYTDASCEYCRRAIAYLDARGVRYEQRVIDQSATAKAEFAKLRQAGVPVLVNERVLILGFDPRLYDMHFAGPQADVFPIQPES